MTERIVTILQFPLSTSFYLEIIEKISNRLSKKVVFKTLDKKDTIEDVKDKIKNSDLVFLEDFNCLIYYDFQLEMFLREWVLAGGNLIVNISLNNLSSRSSKLDLNFQNEFLKPFGMSQMGIKIRPISGYNVNFKKKRTSFLDRDIFRGLEVLSISQPNHIHCESPSEKLLVNDDENYFAVNVQTDSKVEITEACPLAIYEDNDKGCVIGFSGVFTEFSNNDNDLLFINIIDYLLSKRSTYELAYSLYYEIEYDLATSVKKVLIKDSGQDWIKLIPEGLMADLSTRDGEEGDIFEKMNFFHLKMIIAKNWEGVFKKYFPSQGKKKALSWIGKVNEIRKVIAHPIKSIEGRKINLMHVRELRKYKNQIKVTFD